MQNAAPWCACNTRARDLTDQEVYESSGAGQRVRAGRRGRTVAVVWKVNLCICGQSVRAPFVPYTQDTLDVHCTIATDAALCADLASTPCFILLVLPGINNGVAPLTSDSTPRGWSSSYHRLRGRASLLAHLRTRAEARHVLISSLKSRAGVRVAERLVCARARLDGVACVAKACSSAPYAGRDARTRMAGALRMAGAGGPACAATAVAPVADWLADLRASGGLTGAQVTTALAVSHSIPPAAGASSAGAPAITAPAVFAPCILVAGRWMLGKVLGPVYAPLGPAGPPAAARFALDLCTGALVEARAYGAAGVVFVAHARAAKEYAWAGARVELRYERADGAPLNFALDPPPSWAAFCNAYAAYLPVGDLYAVPVAPTGPPGRESIVVTHDRAAVAQYALSNHQSLLPYRSAARAPRRLLPRPPG